LACEAFRRKSHGLSIHKPGKARSSRGNVSDLEKVVLESDAIRSPAREMGAVQQKFADRAFDGRRTGRVCLGFDSSCAIRIAHLGKKLHGKLRQAVQDSYGDRHKNDR
jgi:hypothetical protein